MTFTIPNVPTSATFEQQAQSSPDQYDFQALANADALTGVVSGCAVTAHGGTLSVDIAVGVVAVGGVEVAVGAVSGQAIGAADASNPRFDLVVVSAAGVVSVTAGAASSNPVFPAVTSSQVLLAAVYIAATSTTLASNDLTAKGVGVPAAMPMVNMLPASDRTIPASYSLVVSEGMELATGITLEIGALGVMELL